MTEQSADIVVIGAGAAGLSAAYFLSADANVTVVEAEAQPAYHSSGRSAAMYIEGYENPEVQALTIAGKNFFFSPPEGFAEHALVTPCGGLTAAGPGEDEALQRYLSAWQKGCPELVKIGPEETRELVPLLRTDWITAAAYDPTWHNIDVHGLLSGFQKGIRQNGGTVRCDFRVTAINRTDGRWQLTAADTSIEADLVVNAAGAWAGEVAQLAGASDIKLTPMRRTAAIVPAPELMGDWPLVHTVSEDLYFKPESPGLMVCPQDETPSAAMDAFPVDLDVAVALDRFTQIADYEPERVMHQWAGLRTFSADRRPVVGFDRQVNGFFWLAGQGGFGIQTSPGIGQLVAEIVLNGARQEAAIAPERFANGA